jgi:uridine kinase
MVKNMTPGPYITAVIGARKSGKTTACEILNSMHPDSERISMMGYGIRAFADLHDIRLEAFWQERTREENRSLYNVFSEHQRKQNPRIFLDPILAFIKSKTHVIIDDIFYYNELQALVECRAHILLLEVPDDTRLTRGWTKSMNQQPMEQEVAAIKGDTIKHWRNVEIIQNTMAINEFRFILSNCK